MEEKCKFKFKSGEKIILNETRNSVKISKEGKLTTVRIAEEGIVIKFPTKNLLMIEWTAHRSQKK